MTLQSYMLNTGLRPLLPLPIPKPRTIKAGCTSMTDQALLLIVLAAVCSCLVVLFTLTSFPRISHTPLYRPKEKWSCSSESCLRR